ncbi:hypothetical protein M758_UG246500 [Ceratodon purpureus]|nr:hypothetical protein M758_UG246500 [Ceratodon purpureus]
MGLCACVDPLHRGSFRSRILCVVASRYHSCRQCNGLLNHPAFISSRHSNIFLAVFLVFLEEHVNVPIGGVPFFVFRFLPCLVFWPNCRTCILPKLFHRLEFKGASSAI